MADSPEIARIKRFIESGIPFNAHLGIKVYELTVGRAVLWLPWQDHFIGDPFRPALHGGVTSTMMDVSGGAACFSQVNFLDGDRLSTVDLRVDYLLPGPPRDLYCEATVQRMGNRVATVLMSLFAASEDGQVNLVDDPIAIGRGVYNVRRKNGSGT
jgi:uncharacterized protein (TIGR00369 family)